MTQPEQLQPTVDYSSVVEAGKILPVSWASTFGLDLATAQKGVKGIIAEGEEVQPMVLARLIGAGIAHLRMTTLANGLRYVRIHLDDGTEIYNNREYALSPKPRISQIYDRYAETINGMDLGDGFRLTSVSSDSNTTTSFVEKNFGVAGKKVTVFYKITPGSEHEDRDIRFSYEVLTPDSMNLNEIDLTAGGVTKTYPKNFIAKNVKVEFTSPPSKEKGLPGVVGGSTILVSYNIPDEWGRDKFDTVEFDFNHYGRLETILGRSQGSGQNPDWTDGRFLAAIGKGQNVRFRFGFENILKHGLLPIYQTPELETVQVVVKEVFGQDISLKRLNTRATLNALLDAAIHNRDIDVTKVAPTFVN